MEGSAGSGPNGDSHPFQRLKKRLTFTGTDDFGTASNRANIA